MGLEHGGLSDYEKLMESRRILRDAVREGMMLRTKRKKLALLERWKKELSPVMLAQVLRVLRNERVRVVIANWELDEFK